MHRRKQAIVDKFLDFLINKHPECDVQMHDRRSLGTAGTWGVIKITRPGYEIVLLRVSPLVGVHQVEVRNGKYWNVEKVLSKKQLQYQFGYAPVPRKPDQKMFPFSRLSLDIFKTPVGGKTIKLTRQARGKRVSTRIRSKEAVKSKVSSAR